MLFLLKLGGGVKCINFASFIVKDTEASAISLAVAVDNNRKFMMKKDYVMPLASRVEIGRVRSVLAAFSLSGNVEDYEGAEEVEP